MEINEKKLKAILKEQSKELSEDFQRQNNVLYEKFRGDIKIIGEGWNATREKVETMSVRLDATFEMVGSMKEDLEIMKEDTTIMKEDMGIMKMDISFIKNGLKQKADKDELEALEKRVLFLESKMKGI